MIEKKSLLCIFDKIICYIKSYIKRLYTHVILLEYVLVAKISGSSHSRMHHVILYSESTSLSTKFIHSFIQIKLLYTHRQKK